MAYSKLVIEHYENPKNVGKMDTDDPCVGTGLVGAPACGDVLRLQIKIDPNTNIITDAKWKTYGCGSAIAASSYVSEVVKGLTLDQTAEIKNSQISEELSLPPVKIHCSILAESALRMAVEDFKNKQKI